MFQKILIANRGEIACRVIATCRRLGVGTVAVFSDADAGAAHAELADEAVRIGPAPASESYLDIAAIVGAAVATGAEAIHPGYGFLSERAEFADAVAAAGLVLIGPPAASMRAMGSKAAAKSLMGEAGVPLVPGYHGAAQDAATLRDAAAEIGFPVLIKASSGGGGRGMRVVTRAEELDAAIEGAAREAVASFGDGRLLIEKYLTRPRHIEIQVFADTHGNTVSLFERDCSIQRRHQKVIEEAPAPGMGAQRRRAMGDAAVAAARAVGYVGAGTVEFITEAADGADDAGLFYFMEMNTRLQVEHPVTEMITGLDLVEWQLRVASGERLPLLADELAISGHAIEARIYAEDPARGFLPSIGRVTHLRAPEAGAHVRVDSGVRAGDAITPYYDAMIAKLIVWGADRAAALRRLRVALAHYEIAGVRTNLDLLRAIAEDADFAAGGVDTGFIERHPEVLALPGEADAVVWVAAVLAARAGAARGAEAGDPWSPWLAGDGWRMNVSEDEWVLLRQGDALVRVAVRQSPGGVLDVALPGGAVTVSDVAEDGARFRMQGVLHRVRVLRQREGLVVIRHGRNTAFGLPDPWAPPAAAQAAAGKLTAPIPARVTRVLVAVGDAVAAGAALLVLEAMKMELTIAAPFAGVVDLLAFAVGDMVQEGAELARLAPAETG